MRYDSPMHRTDGDAIAFKLEAFEHAMANARRSESDLPSADALLRAMRLCQTLVAMPHDGEIEVFIAADGGIELIAFAADSQLILEVTGESLELLVKSVSTGDVLLSEARATEKDVERWVERAA